MIYWGHLSSRPHYLLAPILLEQNIIHLTQGPSLFHRHLQVLKEDESTTQLLLKELHPPESLCSPDKRLKEYKNISLDPKDPLFSQIYKTMAVLQTTIFSSERGKEASQKIIALYESYIQKVCTKMGKERMQLLKGPAYLLGVGEETLCLDRKIALDLASLDKYGQSAKSNIYGSSAVKKIEKVYFKRVAGMNPLCPGMKFAVDSLNKILIEEGSTPTQLIKIEGIWIRAVLDESTRGHESQKLCAQEIAEGHSIGEFFIRHSDLKGTYPFKEKRITQIAQASHSIEGINFLEFMQDKKNLSLIDPYNFSIMTLLGICISPSDGRADNYMAVKERGALFKATGIDNDQAFTSFFLHRDGMHYLNLRYVFFLLPQMQNPIALHLSKNLEKASPELLLLEWIASIHKKNAFYQNLLENGTLNRFEYEDLGLPITLSFASIHRIYQTLLRAKSFLKDQSHATNWELLHHLSPHIALIYQKLIEDAQGDILNAQEKLFVRRNDPIIWETFFGENPPLPPPSEEIEGSLKLPEKLLSQWIESLSFAYPEEQERFLDKLFLAFPELNKISLPQCTLKDRSFVEIFLRVKDLQELKIENFLHLTIAGLLPLIQKHTRLHLIIGKDHQLKSEEIADLVKYAWDKGRKISVQLEPEVVPLSRDSLEDSLLKMLEEEQLVYAETLCILGADLYQKDGNGNTLLHQFADKNPKVLGYLLSKRLPVDERNKKRETPLHIAAKKGTGEHVQILFDHKALLEERDLDGRAPLHHAVIQGNEATAIILLDLRVDLRSLSYSQQSVFHLAAEYGHLAILENLINRASNGEKEEVQEILHLRDHDGKTPLHLAVWGLPKPQIVSLLLKLGTDPNVQTNALNPDTQEPFNYTPLHWAAKNGHLESAKVLLSHGADLSLTNINEDTPLDLALRWGQDSVIKLFIDPKHEHEIEEIPLGIQDIEGYHYQKFEKAYEDFKTFEQIFHLEKMADLVLQKRNYMQASHLLNAVYAVAKNYHYPLIYQKLIQTKLERIEGLFLFENFGIKVPSGYRGQIARYQSHLEKARKKAQEALEKKFPAQLIQISLTEQYRMLLSLIISDSIKLLRKEPPPFAIFCLGSMSREEICPYSDVEFGFFIEK